MKTTLTVNGMHCNSCKLLIQEALEDAGATDVTVSLDEKQQRGVVTLKTTMSKAQLAKIIGEQGDYTVQ